MKYSSFATLAALVAAISIAGSHPTSASAKVDPVSASKTVADNSSTPPAPMLYAQASAYTDTPAPRNEVGPAAAPSHAPGSTAKNTDEQAPLNLLGLIVAGAAVMGSLALRRSPNK